MDGMTHFIHIDRRSLIRENTLLQDRNPIDWYQILVHLMRLAFLPFLSDIFNQLVCQIIIKTIDKILLLHDLNLNNDF